MLDDCMTNQHRKGHAPQIIAEAAACRGCRRFWAVCWLARSNPDWAMRIGTDKSPSVRLQVQARSSVDANRPKRSSKAHEGSLCGRPQALALKTPGFWSK